MKKYFFGLTIFLSISTPPVFAQETITLTTFYPSPQGAYGQLRLIPKPGPVTCNASLEGLMYYNLTDNEMKICGDTGWKGLSFWERNSTYPDSIYYTNLTTPDTAKVGIGTTDPIFKLSLENDGGILAIGTTGSGQTLPVAGAGTRFIWYPRKAAFRSGEVTGTQWDDANIGQHSFATGYNALASGASSIALGNNAQATGDRAFAQGFFSVASGALSVAMGGGGATAKGSNSFAFLDSSAYGNGSIAMGNSNQAGGDINDSNIGVYAIALGFENQALADYSFASGFRSTASGINSFAFGDTSTAAGRNSLSLGRENFTYGNYSTAIGWQNTTGESGTGKGHTAVALGWGNVAKGLSSAAIGSGSKAYSNYGFAHGYQSEAGGDPNDSAIGLAAAAFGYQARATGVNSFATGYNTQAQGDSSVAMGNTTTASGVHATALNYGTVASGTEATAIGRYTTSQAFASTVVGAYNVISGDTANWIATDPLFVVGNGILGTPSNAMTVLKNGNVGIGTTDPLKPLDVRGQDVTARIRIGSLAPGGYAPGFEILNHDNNAGNSISKIIARDGVAFTFEYVPTAGQDEVDYLMAIDDNGWIKMGLQPMDVDPAYPLEIKLAGIGTPARVTTTGNICTSSNNCLDTISDDRLKKNIRPLSGALGQLLELRGVEFEWKDTSADPYFKPGSQVGFIAQEVEKVNSQWTATNAEGQKVLSMNGFEAVAVEAIRELKNAIDLLKLENEHLKLRIKELENQS